MAACGPSVDMQAQISYPDIILEPANAVSPIVFATGRALATPFHKLTLWLCLPMSFVSGMQMALYGIINGTIKAGDSELQSQYIAAHAHMAFCVSFGACLVVAGCSMTWSWRRLLTLGLVCSLGRFLARLSQLYQAATGRMTAGLQLLVDLLQQ